MSRRRARSPIPVEVRPDPVRHAAALASRLLEVDRGRFERVVAMMEGYVKTYDFPDEPEWSWKARLAIATRGPGATN